MLFLEVKRRLGPIFDVFPPAGALLLLVVTIHIHLRVIIVFDEGVNKISTSGTVSTSTLNINKLFLRPMKNGQGKKIRSPRKADKKGQLSNRKR